ncbi:MAG: dephospho-CoA kinase [Spirochaetia bacterium]
MVIGVAGKYCAGKSTVAHLLGDAGYRIIDVDRLGHEALARRVEDVRAAFGDDYLNDDGTVNRAKLGGLVFRNRNALRRLETIVHPEMQQMVRERLSPQEPGTVVNAALLFPMGLDALCDLALWVQAPLLTRMRRARNRDKLPLRDILRRFWTQRELDPQSSASAVDIYNVDNRGGLERLRAQLAALSLLKE